MTSRTISGSSSTSGMPGIAASPSPPTTSRIGYGMRVHWAAISSAVTVTRTKSSAISVDIGIVVAAVVRSAEMELRVADNPEAERYEVFADGELAGFVTYRLRDGQ